MIEEKEQIKTVVVNIHAVSGSTTNWQIPHCFFTKNLLVMIKFFLKIVGPTGNGGYFKGFLSNLFVFSL